MEHEESYWERLVNSEHSWERSEALKAGYGLDRFVHDSLYVTRAEVAKQGYGLDLLSNDPHTYVQKSVREYLAQHETTLEDWIRDNPDKCVYPVMKKQMQDAGLRVGEITLLTTDEAKKHASFIPKGEKAFWVQPGSHPVYSDFHAFTVGPHHLDRVSSMRADYQGSLAAIRPALRMQTCRYPKLHRGDKLALLGNAWTVLDVSPKEVLLFSDKSLDTRKFGKTGPYYETSDVQKYLDEWLEWKLGKDERGPVETQIETAKYRQEQDFFVSMKNAFEELPETVDKRNITADEFYTHICENKACEALKAFLDSHDMTSQDDEFLECFWNVQKDCAKAREPEVKKKESLTDRIARAQETKSQIQNTPSKEPSMRREQQDF